MISRWERVILVTALLKVVISLIGFFVFASPQNPSTPFPPVLFFANILVFALTAGFLILGSHEDVRAVYLGGFFLITAAAFSPVGGSAVPVILRSFSSLPTDAFWPFFLWLFVVRFPEGPVRVRLASFEQNISRFAGAIGFGLFILNAVRLFGIEPGILRSIFSTFSRSSATSLYWAIWFVLILPALPIVIWKAKRASPTERRRVSIFVLGLVAGITPLMLAVIVEVLVPGTLSPRHRLLAAGFIVYPALLSVPITTSYSVVVLRVLDVRLLVRKGLQYAFARYTLVAATALPFVALISYLVMHRENSLTDIASNTPKSLLGAAALGVVALQSRRHVFDALDRRFFREQHDARIILGSLIDQSRQMRSLNELANLLQEKIGKALHVECVAVLFRDESRARLVDVGGSIRALDLTTPLAVAIASAGRALEVNFKKRYSDLANLPLEDQQWLVDAAFQLLMPFVGADGRLLGLLGLGDKKSELPFSTEDRQLIAAIASSAAVTVESRHWLASGTESTEVSACVCSECGKVYPPDMDVCRTCETSLHRAAVPYALLGKFRFDKQLGSGGMGVVYRAVDLNLGTAVAIKTLRRRSPQEAIRLRKEARLIARFKHPNLVEIRGFESWHGTPMLVFEYLDGGTLADRLRREPLTLAEAVQLGITLSDVLEYIHGEGVFHLDMKPGNIGYAGPVPKVLDFGVATMERAARTYRPLLPSTQLTDSSKISGTKTERDVKDDLVGTPAYWPPETLSGAPKAPTFDLWATALLLYESLTCINPMMGKTLQDTLLHVRIGTVPEIQTLLPQCSSSVSAFFRDSLSFEPRHRPSNAKVMRRRLEELKSEMLQY